METERIPIELFYSYAHEDETYRVQLENHLAGMRRARVIGTWDDRKITPGSNWNDVIREKLERANIILALLSADFIASDYAVNEELKRALEREKEGKARVIGVVIRPVVLDDLPLSRKQLVPTDARAIDLWENKDLAFVDVVKQLRRVVEEIGAKVAEQHRREPVAAPPPAPQRAWSIPKRNVDFVGREPELERLGQILATGTTPALAAIVGEAGVGKSQLSFEYAHRHSDAYDFAWAVRAERTESIAADLGALAARLGVAGEGTGRESDHPSAPRARRSAPLAGAAPQVTTVSSTGTGDAAVDALMTWLADHDRWLLIFDNASSLASVSSYIPKRGAGHVLITSRNDALPASQSVRLEPFREKEAVQFLVERAADTSSGSRVEAERLVSSLGSLPLALEYAASFVGSSDNSFADYLALIEKAVATKPKAALGDPATRIAATWEVSLDKLGPESPAALLFDLCAWLAPEDIPRSIFTDGVALVRDELKSVVADPLLFSHAIAELLRLGIVTVRGDAFTTHRLAQRAAQDRLTSEERREAIASVVRLMHAVYPSSEDIPDATSWDSCERYLPHAVAIANHAMSPSDDPRAPAVEPELAGDLLWRVGDYQYERARYLEAKSTLDRALSIAQCTGLKHRLIADIHNSLGNVLLDWRGDYDNAKREYMEAVSVDQAIGAEKTHDAAIHLNNVGFTLEQQGQLQLALAYYKQALEIEVAAGELVEAAKTMLNVGSISETLGNMDAAKRLYGKAIDIQRNAETERNELADALSAMATLMLDTDDIESARQHLTETLTLYKSVHGDHDHPDIARNLVNLARVSLAEGKTADARGNVDRAIEMYRRVLGKDVLNPSLGAAHYVLGEIHEHERNFDEAKREYETALNHDDQGGNATSLGVAEDLEALGGVLEKLGRRDDALSKYEHALRLYVAAYGAEHEYARAVAQKRDELKGH